MKKSLFFGFVLFLISSCFIFANGFKPTLDPVVLPEGTSGSFRENTTYLLFGDWPQSLKDYDVTIDTSKSEEINGWTCYKGSDDCYYVKETAKNFDWRCFDNGLPITAGEEYYFKMEPIKWRLLDDDFQNGKLFLAENILDMKRFDTGVNNYEESQIRSYLNNEFLTKAFAPDAITKIRTTTVDNSAESTTDSDNSIGKASDSVCSDTQDKVFLISESEVTKRSYGFEDCWSGCSRDKEAVDYARLNKGDTDTWWLRSPFEDLYKSKAQYVSDNGAAYDAMSVHKKSGVVPAIVISEKYFAPENIISLNTVVSDKTVNFAWKNPNNISLKKVIISGLGDSDIVVSTTPGTVSKKEVTGLSNDKLYKVTIYAVNELGKKSSGISLEIIPGKVDSNIPRPLPNGTNGTFGTDAKYVLFGLWPQSVKADFVNVDEGKVKQINGWSCVPGDDGCYYVKCRAELFSYSEFITDGKIIKDGIEYYFKLEPIKWCVVSDNFQGGKMLFAENILTSIPFDSDNNNYANSDIRNFLNNDFIDKAFSVDGASKLQIVTVDNSAKSAEGLYGGSYNSRVPNPYVCENTEDKVFLLSAEESTNKDFGFKESNERDSGRSKKTTDYAYAKGNLNQWWIRSPENQGERYSVAVEKSGKIDFYSNVWVKHIGVVPAIVLSYDNLLPSEIKQFDSVFYNDVLTLSFVIPEDENISKVNISRIDSGNIAETVTLNCTSNSLITKKFYNLKKDSEYSFVIKTVYKSGVESEGVIKTAKTKELPLTTEVVLLPEGTDGSVGTDGQYVLFGDWPQTVKSDDVTIDTSLTEKINGWICYKGSDDCYYVKKRAEVNDSASLRFSSNNQYIVDGREYYFKMEPIKWRVVTDNYQGGKLLVAESPVTAMGIYTRRYGKRNINNTEIYSNNYKYSSVRAFLNGLNGIEYDVENYTGEGFINKAFIPDAAERLITVNIDNGEKSALDNNDYLCENTKDKVFLLSKEEVTNSNYGYKSRSGTDDNVREKKAVDYASANRGNGNWWWLRTPDDSPEFKVCNVFSDGTASYIAGSSSPYGGVVPAIVIPF